MPYDVIIIGGGFYGCSIAVHVHKALGKRPLLLEMRSGLLGVASYANQARVHNGYHYPRNLLTGLRSRVNYPRFVEDFRDCIWDEFDHYYAIAKRKSRITASQFHLFCERIGAPIEPAPEHVVRLFRPEFVEQVFLVREVAFDAVKLRRRMAEAIEEYGIRVEVDTEALRIRSTDDGLLELTCRSPRGERVLRAEQVLNCTYSRMNQLLVNSGLSAIPLKHELAEITLIEVPEKLQRVGVTVMCGRFFSTMPFPARGLHSLSHVGYTPHCEWHDSPEGTYEDPYTRFATLPKQTNFVRMVKDARRYLPALEECRYVDSLWAVKTVLPQNEEDDGRPILMKRDTELPALTCIMGSKIDNIYDVLDTLPVSPAARMS